MAAMMPPLLLALAQKHPELSQALYWKCNFIHAPLLGSDSVVFLLQHFIAEDTTSPHVPLKGKALIRAPLLTLCAHFIEISEG